VLELEPNPVLAGVVVPAVPNPLAPAPGAKLVDDVPNVGGCGVTVLATGAAGVDAVSVGSSFGILFPY
jgi:hypothetical protein